jgi:hypothetical protein
MSTYSHFYQIARSLQTDVEQIKAVAELLGIPILGDTEIPESLEPFVLKAFQLSRDNEITIEDAIEQVKPELQEFSSQASNTQHSDTQTPNEPGSGTPDHLALTVRSQVDSVQHLWRQEGRNVLEHLHRRIAVDAKEMAAQINASPQLFWLQVTKNLEWESPIPFQMADSESNVPPISGVFDRRMLDSPQQNLLSS